MIFLFVNINLKWSISRNQAAFLTGSTAENWVKCHNIFFDGKIILSSSYSKITFLSPFWPVWVSDNPIFCVAWFINSPAHHQDRVVLRHPGVPRLVHGFATSCVGALIWKLHERIIAGAERILNFLSTHVGDGFRIKLACLLGFGDALEAFFAYNTAFVSLE